MWSIVQYRRLQRDARREWHNPNQHRKTDSNATGTEKSQSPRELESGTARHGRNEDGEPKRHLSSTSSLKQERKMVVQPDSADDPIIPKNWPLLARSKNITILTGLIFVQAWAGAAESQANSQASKEFHVSPKAEQLSTAMYLFGIGSGCLFVGPLSETIGRNPTYLSFTFFYLFFVLGSALTPTFGGQVICRYLVGVFSSATLGINGASVKDQFRPVKRAFVFPVIAWANVVPPVIAPIVGGWVASRTDLDWRWMEWITLIISGFAFLIAFLFLPETYLPVLLDWKAKHLRKITGNERYVSEHAENASFTKRLKEILPMPAIFFATEPVIALLGGYLVLLYILLFSFLAGFDYIFKKTYHLSSLETGACFGSIAAGATCFTLFAPALYSWARHHTEHVHGAKVSPEFRLWPAIATAPLLPISLFWLGWTNYRSISIWSGLGACFTFGIVLIAMYVSSYEYIIDSYGEHAAVALASITMVRYLIAGGMVMAARPMYEGIGVHWTMTLLGCIAIVLTPGPYLLYKAGQRIRKKSKYANNIGAHLQEADAPNPSHKEGATHN